jgi:hypothetical protein
MIENVHWRGYLKIAHSKAALRLKCCRNFSEGQMTSMLQIQIDRVTRYELQPGVGVLIECVGENLASTCPSCAMV